MADFEGILTKALAARPQANEDERSLIYDRARKAIIGQLKSIEPSLPLEEISRQKLELEAAIRAIESRFQNMSDLHDVPEMSDDTQPSSKSLETLAEVPQAEAPQWPERHESKATHKSLAEDIEGLQKNIEATSAPQKPSMRADDVFMAAMGSNAKASPSTTGNTPDSLFENQSSSDFVSQKEDALDVSDEGEDDLSKLIPDYDENVHYVHEEGGFGLLAKAFIGVLLLLLIGGTGYALWQSGFFESENTSNVSVLFENTEPAQNELAEQQDDAATRSVDVLSQNIEANKITDRLLPNEGGEVKTDSPRGSVNNIQDLLARDRAEQEKSSQSHQVQPAIAIAQTAILYQAPEQGQEQGTRADGQIIWSMDRAETGMPIIRADIKVPARNLSVKFSLSKNTDPSLPATHLLEFDFQNLSHQAENNVNVTSFAGVIAKAQEEARGEPLRGVAAKVREGVFWQALSQQVEAQELNQRLMREAEWFDILVLFEGDKRSILTLEKGSPGAKVFEEALSAWQ